MEKLGEQIRGCCSLDQTSVWSRHRPDKLTIEVEVLIHYRHILNHLVVDCERKWTVREDSWSLIWMPRRIDLPSIKMEKKQRRIVFLGGHNRRMMFTFEHIQFEVTLRHPCIAFKGPVWHSVERYMWRYKFGSLIHCLPDMKNWLIGKDLDAGKDLRREEKGTTEDEMVGWHHRVDGLAFEQAPWVGDGQGSLTCYSPWGCKESGTTDCTELNCDIKGKIWKFWDWE